MIESNFQQKLKKEIRDRYPGCLVLKNDPTMIDGIPDLTVLYRNRWAFLEVKKDAKANRTKNQIYYVVLANRMSSYGSFIYPENKEDVFSELDRVFGVEREALPVQPE